MEEVSHLMRGDAEEFIALMKSAGRGDTRKISDINWSLGGGKPGGRKKISAPYQFDVGMAILVV